jgi:glyoxylase-like metal-dependent hydrolase (beta-lactamase superfamily II)
MRTLEIGNVTITSIIERDGPWRRPEDMFPAYDPDAGLRHLAELDPEVFDPVSGRLVITYQTYVVRTPQHTILVDTCTGEDKGYAPPMDFPKQPWLDGFRDAGLKFDDIDYVFCTHLHIDHCGWNTVLRNGRWVPTFPNAKYMFHKREYAAWEEATKRGDTPPGNAGGTLAPTVSWPSRRDRHFRAADPFSASDHRTGRGRRRQVPLPVHSQRP